MDLLLSVDRPAAKNLSMIVDRPAASHNAMSSKTRKRVEAKFGAASFNQFSDLSAQQQKESHDRAEMKALFYNPANRQMNRTFQPWGGRGGRGGWRGNRRNSGQDSGEYGERIL